MAESGRTSWQELLIEAVRARPALYDKAHKDYKDVRGVKYNLWNDIFSEMVAHGFGETFTNIEVTMTKWKSLRDGFQRASLKQKTRSGQAPAPPPTYPWYNQLLWLRDHNRHGSSTTNMQRAQTVVLPEPAPVAPVNAAEEEPDATSAPSTPAPPIPAPPTPAQPTSAPPSPANVRRRRSSDGMDQQLRSQLLSVGQAIINDMPSAQDADISFGNAIGLELKKIYPATRKIRAKAAIWQILLKAELDEANE